MIRAYKEYYLYNAANSFGSMLDYAVNDCALAGDKYLHMFIASGWAHYFERGHPKVIAGMSGIELALETIRNATGKAPEVRPAERDYRTPEYWAGWALARYQWYASRGFSAILQVIPYSVILDMYPTLHEADITKFYSVADDIFAREQPETNLKRIRASNGLSQARLAMEADVSLRSVQMYEQRHKNINKAQALSLVKIARVLGCEVEDLLERSGAFA